MLFIGMGFLLIVLAMGALVVFGLSRLGSMYGELEAVISQHNAKIEQIQIMRHVVRERITGVHQLVIEDDPFKREEITQRFSVWANEFLNARKKFEDLGLSNQEKRLFRELSDLIALAIPLHQQVVELLNQDKLPEARVLLKEKSMPAQIKVMEQCDRILEHYKLAAANMEKSAHKVHERDSFIMIMMGGLAASISFVTALTVLTKVNENRESIKRVHDGLEIEVAERTSALKESIAQLAEAQRVSHMGHWEWDLEHDAMHWSDEIYRIFGHSAQAFPASYDRLQLTIHPDDREELTSAIDKVLLDKVPFDLNYRIVRPNGMERVVHQQAHVDFDAGGKLLKILGTIQDVTESKAVESKLKLAASVFENAGEGILITDKDNNIIDINQAFTEITGFKREDVIGQNPGVFKSGKHDPAFYQDMWNTLQEVGQWHGEIWGRYKSGLIFPKWQTINVIRDESGKVMNYIAIFRDISDAKRAEEQLWQLAHFDNLTGVANRSLMYANLRLAIVQAKRESTQVAVMLFDLDGFKQINDAMGHGAGDQLLKYVARQIKDTVSEVDTVARLGGDEFIVILAGIRKAEDVAQVAKKIQAALAQPLTLQSGQELIAKASIGIALYPVDATDIETLMRNADRAMYHAKELGKNNFQFFAEGMSAGTKPCSPIV